MRKVLIRHYLFVCAGVFAICFPGFSFIFLPKFFWSVSPCYSISSYLWCFVFGRGFIIIATPFASGFDHLKIADETQFKFDRCLRALRDDLVSKGSTYGPSVRSLCVACPLNSVLPSFSVLR